MKLKDLKFNLKGAKQALAMAESAGVANEEMIGFQKGYIRAYQEVIDDIEITLECATHMETICLECNKTFKLVPNNIKHVLQNPEFRTLDVILTCPHCKNNTKL